MPHVVHVFTVPDSLVFLRGQVAYMRSRGYRLSVVTSPGAELDAFGQSEGVEVRAVPMPRRISPLGDARSLVELVRILRELRPDLVHAHTPKGGLLGTIAATAARVPRRIYHMRGLPMITATGLQRLLLASTERVSCALATRVLAVSHSLRDYAIDAHLCGARKIDVLGAGSGNGVDCERFDPSRQDRAAARASFGLPEGAPVVGFVGRLVRDKGVVELADAWQRVRRTHPDAHLAVAGVWEERDAVPSATRRALEEDPSVHLLGFVHDTPRFYAALDLLTLPTYREGFPNVPLEAAAMSLPVVTTRVPGCVDAVVDGASGTLVQPGDAIGLAEAIARYLGDPALAEAHGRFGRARVDREFRRERVWSAIADVYDAMLGTAEARGVERSHADDDGAARC